MASQDHDDTSKMADPLRNNDGDQSMEQQEAHEDDISLTITYHKEPVTVTLPKDSTITDLSHLIEADFSVEPSAQKLLITPKPGLLRPPFKDPNLPLSSLSPKAKITLLGSTSSDIASLNATITSVRDKAAARATALRSARKIQPIKYRDPQRAQDESKYTFHAIKPLPFLPNPGKSQRYLEKLASDPGIKAAMRTHKFAVGLLTEMDPSAHTTHESRTLGLNRNAGEVIELRLRTDDYEGYRDYKVIRKTLCHELAHNVHGPHERPFWDLMKEIEKEVEKADWTRGGSSVGGGEFSRPGDYVRDDEVDVGGWTGGSYVLGAGNGSGGERVGLSRREIMALAAEERIKKVKDGGGHGGDSESKSGGR